MEGLTGSLVKSKYSILPKKLEHHLRSGCPVACGLDLLGDHWTLLVVRDLMFAGRHEYKEMLAAGEGIPSNMLSDRLRRLREHELIDFVHHPADRKRKLYFLTGKGKELVRMMVELARWSERHLSHVVRIPEEYRRILVDEPDRFIEMTLARIVAWEAEHLERE